MRIILFLGKHAILRLKMLPFALDAFHKLFEVWIAADVEEERIESDIPPL